MSDRKTDKILPITYTGWDGDEPMSIQYYDAEFLEDFGVFKKGQPAIPCLHLDVAKGILNEFDAEGEIVKSMKVKVIPA